MHDVQNRYDKILTSLKYTVEHLARDPAFRPHLIAMHERGLKDWEILGILSNIAIGVRLGVIDESSPDDFRTCAFALLEKVETREDALQPAVFTDDLLTAHAEIYHAAFLASWQLHWPPGARREGIEKFLITRFGLRDTDVPHPDIFGWMEEVPQS